MGFIQADYIPATGRKGFGTVDEDPVTGQDDIAGTGIRSHHTTVFRGVDGKSPQRRGKAGDLFFPVGDHGGGGNHKGWPFGRAVQHEGYGQNGLAETHVIGKASSGAPVGQAGHPSEAFQLVVPEFGFQSCRRSGTELICLLDEGELHLIFFIDLKGKLPHSQHFGEAPDLILGDVAICPYGEVLQCGELLKQHFADADIFLLPDFYEFRFLVKVGRQDFLHRDFLSPDI